MGMSPNPARTESKHNPGFATTKKRNEPEHASKDAQEPNRIPNSLFLLNGTVKYMRTFLSNLMFLIVLRLIKLKYSIIMTINTQFMTAVFSQLAAVL